MRSALSLGDLEALFFMSATTAFWLPSGGRPGGVVLTAAFIASVNALAAMSVSGPGDRLVCLEIPARRVVVSC